MKQNIKYNAQQNIEQNVQPHTRPSAVTPLWLLPAAASLVLAQPVYAVQYHTLEQVQRVLFPAAQSFQERSLLLTQAQREAIASAAGVRVNSAQVRVWQARTAQGVLGYLFVDDVTGKHDAITYALALSPQGKVEGVEIMDYRETYGGKIRDPAWRAQFVGKTAQDPLKIDSDIHNISGATLSCSHVTDGVRRLLVTFNQVFKERG